MLFFTAFLVLQKVSHYGVSSSAIAPAFYGLERPVLDYELPPLTYGFHELEPYFDEETVKSHYYDFHGGYVEEVNSLLKRWRRSTLKGKYASRMSIIDLLRNMSHIPLKYRNEIKNFGSGLINHNLYWSTISPNANGEMRTPGGEVGNKIVEKFGSFQDFRVAFTEMALNTFGSGYVWLCQNKTSQSNDELLIVSQPNEESPLYQGLLPILGIDLWEHAYIRKMANQKAKYIDSWWYLVDWELVSSLSDWWKTGVKLHDEL